MAFPSSRSTRSPSRVFAGNPAAVCPLPPGSTTHAAGDRGREQPVGDRLLRGREGRAPRSALVHARRSRSTCAATRRWPPRYVVFNHLDPQRKSRSSCRQERPARVARAGDMLALDFPSRPPEACAAAAGPGGGRSAARRERRGRARLPGRLRDRGAGACAPARDGAARTLDQLRRDRHGARAKASTSCRATSPRLGIDEDPVTGSAHCTLTPYWAQRARQGAPHALQVSRPRRRAPLHGEGQARLDRRPRGAVHARGDRGVSGRRLFLDCDGVLADFDAGFEERFGMKPRAYEAQRGAATFWTRSARRTRPST